LKVVDANGRLKGKTEGVGNVGGLGLGPNKAIVAFMSLSMPSMDLALLWEADAVIGER